jgi:hypothetical protein
MAKALTKSQIAATLAEKVGITKKQAALFLDKLSQLAYKQAKNSFTLPGLSSFWTGCLSSITLARIIHPGTTMSRNRILAFVLLLVAGTFEQATARAPAFQIINRAVHLEGVGPDNPVIYDNDWWSDIFDPAYLFARTSLGTMRLEGLIVSRDMWDWQKGYLYTIEQGLEDARRIIDRARASGLRNIPDAVRGADRVLQRPASGQIHETVPQASPGTQLIIQAARRATPQKPLLIICGGPLTTVANALLLDRCITNRVVVFNLTVNGGYNGKDAWSVYVVCKLARYVDWGGGAFWDRNSVFRPGDFDSLPDNPLTIHLKQLLRSDLGQINQLGDGAPLVWLYRHSCWQRAEPRRAVYVQGTYPFVGFDPVSNPQQADLLVIPKEATDLQACREEFLGVLRDPGLFPRN